MKRFPFSVHSFKMKLLISLLTIGLLPLVSISVFYQHFLDVRITKDIESASIDRLRYTSYDIRRQMEISDQLLGWITYNRKLQEILTTDYSEKYEKQLKKVNKITKNYRGKCLYILKNDAILCNS